MYENMYVQCCVISICYDKPFWYFEQRYQEKRQAGAELCQAQAQVGLPAETRLK